MDEVWVRVIIIIGGSILGSGGLWAFLQNRDTKRSASTRLMMGLAYAELVHRGQQYMDRGSITRDELEDYLKYFYAPYKDLGGNGVAERYMIGVTQLPVRNDYAVRVVPPNEEYESHARVVPRSEEASAGR
ncbi:hypothetical protein SEA_SCAP1_24 [Streptomyces phage Scap1]|uniref:Uncharacterized protein n=1 Tax=Streptomyces phage Scap1 TaxID=2041354 RepID=A0A2D1GP16_9CAUD|nr:hypothetical protein FDI71_gp24 [Streptomyces phage Scap1]ATN93673.1 hypothetical protein SEA_SCAP1_24 [Streptomyces phage Scap1]